MENIWCSGIVGTGWILYTNLVQIASSMQQIESIKYTVPRNFWHTDR